MQYPLMYVCSVVFVSPDMYIRDEIFIPFGLCDAPTTFM
jgi:hypothetical protein